MRLTPDQSAGLACIVCGADDQPMISLPVETAECTQLFACRDCEIATWSLVLDDLPAVPDPCPPAMMRALCARLADPDDPRDQGQRAAARAIHYLTADRIDGDRQVRRWCSGSSKIPWTAAELLRRIAVGRRV